MGHFPCKTLHSASSSISTHQLFSFVSNDLIDVSEWSFKPKQAFNSSKEGNSSFVGPITFRTWDFVGLQVSKLYLKKKFFFLEEIFCYSANFFYSTLSLFGSVENN